MSVFFDATGTTSTATTRPFHALEYRWDFGDPAGGATWAYGSGTNVNSKNAATGPVAAHVYETPGGGPYTITLTVRDGTNTVSTSCAQVTVEDPDVLFPGTTLCVDTPAIPTAGMDGCPIGAGVIGSNDFDDVINATAGSGATFKRILFRRGRTFFSSTYALISGNGPGLVGAYGAGAKPLITGASAKMQFGTSPFQGPVDPNFADWRVVDLNFDGVSQSGNGFQTVGPVRQLTFLRVEARNVLNGMLLSDFFLEQINSGAPFTVPLWSEITIADSIIENVSDYGFLGAANRFSVLGSLMRGTSNSTGHVMRLGFTQAAVISNSNFGGGQPGNALTIRGTDFAGGNTIPSPAWTQNVVVSDNRLLGGSNVWFFTIRRVSDGDDARFRNIIVERNWLIASPTTLTMLVTDAGELTVRNNLLDLTGAASHVGIVLGKSSGTPVGVNSNVVIANNSAFAATTTGDNYAFVATGDNSAPAGLAIKNNLSYTPNLTGGASVFSGTTGSGADITNNTDGNNIRTMNPNFATTPPTATAHFRPGVGSYTIDAGASVPVWSDFFMAPRTGTYDLGAVNP